VGLILLGEKYNLKPLTIDEISFLKAINPSLSISIKNSALFAALRTQNDEMGTLQHQLVSLQQDLLKTIQDQTLTSGAIHEFKNTHLAIGGLVQHFLDKSDIDINAVRRILAEIGRQSEYLYLFSQNLLYTNHGQETPIRSDLFSLRDIIDKIVSTHELLITANQVTLTYNLAVPHLNSDKARFQLILGNLIHNAAKYGGKTVEFSSTSTSNAVIVDVISSNFLSAPSTITPGVGLRICERVIKQLGGELMVSSSTSDVSIRLKFPSTPQH